MAKPRVGVVYLAREAEGGAAFRRFADSYRSFTAGVEHDLIVVYKGFRQQGSLRAAQGVFEGIEHRGLELPDVGLDIGTYLEASRRVAQDYLVFLNTHCAIAAPGWLASLHAPAAAEGVGIVGTMGSYESIRDSAAVLKEAAWRSLGLGAAYDPQLAYYFDFIVQRYRPEWYAPKRAPARRLARSAASLLSRTLRYPWLMTKGTRLVWPGAARFDSGLFPPFPNPHIRTNAFVIRRETLLGLPPQEPRSKVDANLYESGPDSLTAQLRRAGLRALVAGRDGLAYELAHWAKSETFRLGAQRNLLVSDNHTRAFEAMSQGARIAHARMTWGDYEAAAPADFPRLGREFRKAEL